MALAEFLSALRSSLEDSAGGSGSGRGTHTDTGADRNRLGLGGRALLIHAGGAQQFPHPMPHLASTCP